MSDVANDTEEIEEKAKPKLKVIAGGLAGSEPPDKSKDWLSELEVGTVFLVEDKTNNWSYIATQFEVTGKSEDHVRLWPTGTSTDLVFWAIPTKFCNKFALKEILGVRNDCNRNAQDGE